MKSMKRSRRSALLGILACTLLALAQSPSVKIARWKNDAKGAYSIMVDDYGTQFFADIQFIDSTTENRGINLSFGVETHWANCTGACRLKAWHFGKILFAKGHEFVSHSATHQCTDDGWDLALEIDSSKAVIEREIPGAKCQFFGFPCGKSTQKRVDYLMTREYIGARGTGGGVNHYTIPDPFHVKRGGYFQYLGLSGLNKFAQDAIDAAGWQMIWCHNIGVMNHFEPISGPIWKSHLDFCRAKMDAGELWMDGIQRCMKYAAERENFGVSIAESKAAQMIIEFDTESNKIHPEPTVSNRIYDERLTLIVTLPAGYDPGTTLSEQNGQALQVITVDATTVRIDADPWAGPVTVRNGPVGTSRTIRNPDVSAPTLTPARLVIYAMDGRVVHSSADTGVHTSLTLRSRFSGILPAGCYYASVVTGQTHARVASLMLAR